VENHDKLLKKLNNGREYRAMRLEVRTADPAAPDASQEVEGYACTFNQPYLLYEYMSDSGTTYRVMEQIDPHAFDDCDMTDVIMQYDHEGRVFARTKNGTLTLTADDTGLKVTADLGGTEIGRQLFAEIKGGYTDKMSFGFTVAEDKRETVRDLESHIMTVNRTITKIKKLYDVSAVSLPANDATSISARKFLDGEIERIKAERLQRADIATKIKLKLLGV
jgi:HK97 family phage prohead protease